MSTPPLSELKALTDSIKAGKRVILLPPGMLVLISIIGLLIAATVTLSGPMISLFAHGLPISIQVGFQFVGMLCIFVFAILPGLMVLHGKPAFTTLSVFYSLLLLLASALMLVLILAGVIVSARHFALPLGIAAVTALLALSLLHSSRFALLKEFFRLLRQP